MNMPAPPRPQPQPQPRPAVAPQPQAAAPTPAPASAPVPPAEKPARESAVVELPSKGVFYGSTCPDGLIEVYPMTGREEGLVAGMDPADLPETFDILLRRCLKTPLDPDEMLSTDKFYVILCLRANSYGSYYEFRVRCPNCGTFQNKHCEVPDDFEILWYKGDGREPFEVTLPRSGHVLKYRLLRGKDDKDVLKWHTREMEKDSDVSVVGDPSYTYRMAKHIVEINGKPPVNIGEAMRFFENLLAADASAFAGAISDHVSGVNTELGMDCKKCKVTFKSDMPFTAGFFRTHKSRP